MKIFLTKKLGVSAITTALLLATSVSVFAAETSGDADLDSLVATMTGGLSTVKAAGLVIVAGVIGIAIVFLGARWVWNMFRSWLSRAQ